MDKIAKIAAGSSAFAGRNFWAYRSYRFLRGAIRKVQPSRTLRGGGGKTFGGLKFSTPSRIILLHWVKKLGLILVRRSKSRVTFGFQQKLPN
jgi:hypothetical protein